MPVLIPNFKGISPFLDSKKLTRKSPKSNKSSKTFELRHIIFTIFIFIFYWCCKEILNIMIDEIIQNQRTKTVLRKASSAIIQFSIFCLCIMFKVPSEYMATLSTVVLFYWVFIGGKKDTDDADDIEDILNNRFRRDRRDRGRGDQHNVHDSQVLSTAKISIDKLKEKTKITRSIPQTVREVRNLINLSGFIKGSTKLLITPQIERATKSLDAIEKNTDIVSGVGCREIDALHLVWNRILEKDHETQKNLKEILVFELNNMHGKNGQLCATGRITRIIDTLNIIDDDVKIVPSHLINEEMMNKSSKIRNDLLNEFEDSEKSKLERGTSSRQTEFDEGLKKIIILSLEKDYVKSGIMTKEKFDIETSKWIDHI